MTASEQLIGNRLKENKGNHIGHGRSNKQLNTETIYKHGGNIKPQTSLVKSIWTFDHQVSFNLSWKCNRRYESQIFGIHLSQPATPLRVFLCIHSQRWCQGLVVKNYVIYDGFSMGFLHPSWRIRIGQGTASLNAWSWTASSDTDKLLLRPFSVT